MHLSHTSPFRAAGSDERRLHVTLTTLLRVSLLPLAPRILVGLALLLTTVSGVGCGPKTDDRMIKWVTPEEAQKAMHDKTGPLGLGGVPDGTYLDPRNEGQYLLGHIPGAINIPFPKLESMYPTVRDRTIIVVYSTDYADDDFAKGVSKRLMELGSKNVLTLRGGLKAWEQSGGDVAGRERAADDGEK